MILRNFCSTKPARGRGGREGERSEKDRNRTRSHLKNGQNIYSANNGEWRGKGPPPMPPLWPLEIAAENRRERFIRRMDLRQKRVRAPLPRKIRGSLRAHTWFVSSVTPSRAISRFLCGGAAPRRSHNVRRHNSICVQIRRTRRRRRR